MLCCNQNDANYCNEMLHKTTSTDNRKLGAFQIETTRA